MSKGKSATQRGTSARCTDPTERGWATARQESRRNERRTQTSRRTAIAARLGAVVLLSTLLLTMPVLVATVAASPSQLGSDAAVPIDNRTTPGGALSETVVTHEARVGASFQASILEVDLRSTSSDRARADRLADFEVTLSEQLAALRERARADDAERRPDVDRRDHGSIARTHAQALALRSLAERANETVASLPENSTRTAGVDDGDFEAVARSSQAIAENGSDRDPDRDDDRFGDHSPFLIDDPDHDSFVHDGEGWHDGDDSHSWTGGEDPDSTGEFSPEPSWGWVDMWPSGPWTGHGGDDAGTGNWGWSGPDDGDDSAGDDSDHGFGDATDEGWNDTAADDGNRTAFGDGTWGDGLDSDQEDGHGNVSTSPYGSGDAPGDDGWGWGESSNDATDPSMAPGEHDATTPEDDTGSVDGGFGEDDWTDDDVGQPDGTDGDADWPGDYNDTSAYNQTAGYGYAGGYNSTDGYDYTDGFDGTGGWGDGF